MGKLWYFSPSGPLSGVLLDEIIPHLDWWGVSFHRAEEWSSVLEKAAECAAMGAGWYASLRCGSGQRNHRSGNVEWGIELYEIRGSKVRGCMLKAEGIAGRRSEAAETIAKMIVAMDGKVWR